MMAKLLVEKVITTVDKQIPFTKEVIKAGTEGEFAGNCSYKYILKFYDCKTFSHLRLEYEASEITVKGELKSIEFVEGK
jgi:hypothetical protein